MKTIAIAAMLAAAFTGPTAEQAQEEYLYLHCKGMGSVKGGTPHMNDVHYRFSAKGMHRFNDTNNVFFDRCEVDANFRCGIEVKDSTISHKQWQTFKSFDGSGKDVFYETTVYISRFTGSYDEWSHQLNAEGRVIDAFASSYKGTCVREASPELTTRRF